MENLDNIVIVPEDVLNRVRDSYINNQKEVNEFYKSYESFEKAFRKIYGNWDPRTNCIIWALNIFNLVNEILYEFVWMIAWAENYKSNNTEESRMSHSNFHVNFCADNCATRIDSCRDKIALMIWSYFCPFNPQIRAEVLIYEAILDRLEHPLKFALYIDSEPELIRYLKLLKNDSFTKVEAYRNFKIHRLDPDIQIYGVKQHHDYDYLVPLISEEKILEFDKRFKASCLNDFTRENARAFCFYKGVLFDKTTIENQCWNYEDIRNHIEKCILSIIEAAKGIYDNLSKREPFDSQNT